MKTIIDLFLFVLLILLAFSLPVRPITQTDTLAPIYIPAWR